MGRIRPGREAARSLDDRLQQQTRIHSHQIERRLLRVAGPRRRPGHAARAGRGGYARLWRPHTQGAAPGNWLDCPPKEASRELGSLQSKGVASQTSGTSSIHRSEARQGGKCLSSRTNVEFPRDPSRSLTEGQLVFGRSLNVEWEADPASRMATVEIAQALDRYST